MTTSVTNRKTIRKALEDYLELELGDLVDKCFDHLTTDFGRKNDNSANVEKAVVVTSGGSKRERDTDASRVRTDLYFNVYTFVLVYFNTERTSEDDLDDIEKAIFDALMDYATVSGTSGWAYAGIEGRSEVNTVVLTAGEFRRERMTVRVELYDD